MDVERVSDQPGSDLDRRARLHAALADPVRLRAVDLLSLGDASPTELQVALGIPSNLLAHHLGVLERHGLVARHRSEADRRRTYLHLVPAALDDLLPSPVQAASRVVFVCTANTARSQLAAALWNRASDVPAASAGTHPADAVAAGTLAVAARRGLTMPPARPRALDDVLGDAVAADDLVVTVCDSAHEELDRLQERHGVRRLHWSVPDPVPTATEAAFDAAYDDLATRVTQLVPRLTPRR